MGRAISIVMFVSVVGCASAQPTAARSSAASHGLPNDAMVKFSGDRVFLGNRSSMRELAGVSKHELVWAPDGDHFAYARQAPSRRTWRVFVRNMAGDSINEFDVYRSGAPRDLEWIDDRRLAYLAPHDSGEALDVYVIHDVQTGEVVTVRRGRMFAWSPGKKHLAYVMGGSSRHTVAVDGRVVWPRGGSRSTEIQSAVSWSPTGRGLAFIERARPGAGRLVVMLELDDRDGDLTWPLPEDALAASMRVFWAGQSRVLVGESNLQPRFAANWERLQ